MTVTSAIEGFISFRGHQVWYRIVKPDQEDSGKLPLLCLHGGPGVPHDYLEPLEAIATTGRQVIFYDQLGCGNSDRYFYFPITNTIPILISEFLT